MHVKPKEPGQKGNSMSNFLDWCMEHDTITTIVVTVIATAVGNPAINWLLSMLRG